MEYTTLGRSDLCVSRVGMGGCPMGQYGWGQVEEQELLDAVQAALDHGINLFDTADVYGMGTSERTLAKALGARRNEAVIATKFGVRVERGLTFYDNSPEWIEHALESSLRRLNTDYIDLYQIHYRDGKTPLEKVVTCLERFRQKGMIRYFGLSNVLADDAGETAPYADYFVSFQDEYSLACRKHETDMLQLAAKLRLTPLTWGSLGQGVLTGKYTHDAHFNRDDRRSRESYVNFHGERFRKNLDIVDAMRPIAEAHQKSLAALAIRFILDHLQGSVVLCGAKQPSQILDNISGCDWQLSVEEQSLLEHISR